MPKRAKVRRSKPRQKWDGHEVVKIGGEEYLRTRYIDAWGCRVEFCRELGMCTFYKYRPSPKRRSKR